LKPATAHQQVLRLHCHRFCRRRLLDQYRLCCVTWSVRMIAWLTCSIPELCSRLATMPPPA
jgi:hypothetical protein